MTQPEKQVHVSCYGSDVSHESILGAEVHLLVLQAGLQVLGFSPGHLQNGRCLLCRSLKRQHPISTESDPHML